MQTIYRPGQWYLIVIPGALVALPPDVPGDVVARLWERMPQQKTLATVVDVLTAHAGGSFSSLPPFVAAVAEGSDVRIALRGGVSARVSTATESRELSGAEVTTWSERFVGGASRIEITVESVEGGAALPVQSGIVRAAAVSAQLESGDERPLVESPGPAPIVEADAAGASAAVLAGMPAPMLAIFGASVPAPAEVTASVPAAAASVPEVRAQHDADAEGQPLESAAEPTTDVEPADAEISEPEISEPEATEPESAEPETDELDISEPAADDSAPAEPEVTDSEPIPTVDGATLLPTEVTIAPAPEEAAEVDDSELDPLDELFGATVHSVPSVAAPTAPPLPTPPPAAGDHDGATISAAELRALRQQPPVDNDAPTEVLPVLPTVPGATGRIRVSTGQVVALDRTVIIGRRPRSTRASGENLPHLIAVESPQQDISRSHLEIRPEGDTVVVIDLRTTNGSTLLRPGADPMRLHPGEQTLVLTGDVVDLGDGVTVAFEDLP
ncbi:FHA domain-containing protein [Microbacterium sp. NPDC087665]|uniref:FHA domain-containing protein n=1 Tax=Microbacterium sp. NPDC087665 TaxID=3364194 RepID=UPI003803D3B7